MLGCSVCVAPLSVMSWNFLIWNHNLIVNELNKIL